MITFCNGKEFFSFSLTIDRVLEKIVNEKIVDKAVFSLPICHKQVQHVLGQRIVYVSVPQNKR